MAPKKCGLLDFSAVPMTHSYSPLVSPSPKFSSPCNIKIFFLMGMSFPSAMGYLTENPELPLSVLSSGSLFLSWTFRQLPPFWIRRWWNCVPGSSNKSARQQWRQTQGIPWRNWFSKQRTGSRRSLPSIKRYIRGLRFAGHNENDLAKWKVERCPWDNCDPWRRVIGTGLWRGERKLVPDGHSVIFRMQG